jgi:NAD(P)-dependent dehydrogenase (short-subunit alcohol dehydrogenase family)
LQYLAKPDYLDFSLPEGSICLLTDDHSPTTMKLAQYLLLRNWKVVILRFPQSLITGLLPLPGGIPSVVLEDLSEEHLKQQLASIATTHGSIGAFIHLNPLLQDPNSNEFHTLDAEKAIVKHVFLIAKHLKKSLKKESLQTRQGCFLTVARLDGAFGLSQTLNFSAISAGLFGLTKTLNAEWESVFCRAIDLHPGFDSDRAAQSILAELHDPNCLISEVAYGVQGRATLVAAGV